MVDWQGSFKQKHTTYSVTEVHAAVPMGQSPACDAVADGETATEELLTATLQTLNLQHCCPLQDLRHTHHSESSGMYRHTII